MAMDTSAALGVLISQMLASKLDMIYNSATCLLSKE